MFTLSLKLVVGLDLLSWRKSNAALCRGHQLAPSEITGVIYSEDSFD